MREMPKNQRDIIRDLWAILIGTNGEGLVGRFKAFVEDSRKRNEDLSTRVGNIEKVLPTLWTKAEHDQAHEKYVSELEAECQEDEERGERRKISSRDWIMIAIVAAGVIAPTLISLLAGK